MDGSQQNASAQIFSVNILGTSASVSDTVKNQSVWFNSEITLSRHFQVIYKFCHIRRYLTQEALIIAANALVVRRLDNCNSLFGVLSAYNIWKLQCLQNSFARIVTNIHTQLNCRGYYTGSLSKLM